MKNNSLYKSISYNLLSKVFFVCFFIKINEIYVLMPLFYGLLMGHPYDKTMKHDKSVFIIAFMCYVTTATVFAYLIGSNATLSSALELAFMIGCGWVATSFGINYAFAKRSFKLFLIDSVYHLGQFIIYGIILGLWH